MEILFENEDLRIAFAPGDSETREAIIIFTGCRHSTGGIERDDFASSNSLCGIYRDVYYVNDLRRSWYNKTKYLIIDVLNKHISQNKRTITIGNSMGGFGAILFSGYIRNCDTSISYVPQYSVHDDTVKFETRWREFRDTIKIYDTLTCLEPGSALDPIRKYLFFGTTDALDEQHRQVFQKNLTRSTSIFSIFGTGHDVTFHLKRLGILHSIINAAITHPEATQTISNILERADVGYRMYSHVTPVPNPSHGRSSTV